MPRTIDDLRSDLHDAFDHIEPSDSILQELHRLITDANDNRALPGAAASHPLSSPELRPGRAGKRGRLWRLPATAAAAVVVTAISSAVLWPSVSKTPVTGPGAPPASTSAVGAVSVGSTSDVPRPSTNPVDALGTGPCGPSMLDVPELATIGLTWSINDHFIKYTNNGISGSVRIQQTASPIILVNDAGIMMASSPALDTLPTVAVLDAGDSYDNPYILPLTECAPSSPPLPDGTYRAMAVALVSTGQERSDHFAYYRSAEFDVQLKDGRFVSR